MEKCELAEYYLLTGDKRNVEITKNIAAWGKKWGKLSRPKFRPRKRKEPSQ